MFVSLMSQRRLINKYLTSIIKFNKQTKTVCINDGFVDDGIVNDGFIDNGFISSYYQKECHEHMFNYVITYRGKQTTLTSEKWYEVGHRSNGPSNVEYYKNGNIQFEEWFKHGYLHRTDGPAAVFYNENGTVRQKVWYKQGIRYRIDGPADILYDDCGKIYNELWYRNGSLYMVGIDEGVGMKIYNI